MENFSDVHDALKRAQLAEREKVVLINTNFKIHPQKKEMAEQICAAHGTTLSAFLRECVHSLVADYAGEKTVTEIAGV